MYSTQESSFLKYMIWRGIGTKVSKMSRLGQDIEYNNSKPRPMSSREIELITKHNKAVNAMYFWPIKNILEIMSRNGKIMGTYINGKQGWEFEDITLEEIKTKHKFEWKVRHEKLEDFIEDMELIRDYRIYHADKDLGTEEARMILSEMMEKDWTMNQYDGYLKIKQLHNKYKMDTIKTKNLEFRLRCDNYMNGITEIPIVIEEDSIERKGNKYNPIKLQIIEKKWFENEVSTNIPIKKKKGTGSKKDDKIKTEEIRIGTKEMLQEMKEIKTLLIDMKKTKIENEELMLLDKADQIREIERSIFDEETKDKVKQIILCRKDPEDLPYKMLEETLLTGKNYLVEMPRIEKFRNNIIGMMQEIEECKPEEWEDENIANRLQKIAGTRIKKLINSKMEEIIDVLLNFKKEIDLANDIKSLCEDKDKLDMEKFKNMLRETIETKEYKNIRYEFLERWCIEIEENWERGLKKMKNENMEPKSKKYARYCTKGYKRKYEISSDEDEIQESGMRAIMSHDESERKIDDVEKRKNKDDSNEEKGKKTMMSQTEIIEISSEEKNIKILDDKNNEENINFIIVTSSEDEDN